MTFYFVRHGETDWNAARRLQGQIDVPLNELGRRQAARCSEILGGLGVKPVSALSFVASPLIRARETMEIIRGGLGMEAVGYSLDRRLVEMSYGLWEGLTYLEVLDQHPHELPARNRDKWNYRPPEGESYADLFARVQAWHAEIEGDIVLAAHGGVARTLMVLYGVCPADDATTGTIDQGVVYEFSDGVMHRHE